MLWFGLGIAALLVVATPILIGGANRTVHTATGALAAIVAAFALMLISLLDHPFAGTIAVQPTDLQNARASIPQIATHFPHH
jgi:hypothetical protein